MGVVRLYMSMSLDGFVADRDSDSTALYPDLENLRNNEALAEMIETTGAVAMGRRSYDMGDTEEGYVDYEHQVPIFVLTSRVPEVPAKHDPGKGLTFTFVTDGVESAVRQAQAAAGERRPGDRQRGRRSAADQRRLTRPDPGLADARAAR